MSKEEGGAGGGGSGGVGEPSQAQYVGPYRLDKTLGKGQTGRIETFFYVKFLVLDEFKVQYVVGINAKKLRC